MTIDLDKGGVNQVWQKLWLGPSVGWTWMPNNILPIATAGTFTVDPSTSLITVAVAGSVTIILPSAINPPVPAVSLPSLYIRNPVTIVDIAGNALLNPITIKPASIAETIMGLTQIQITVNYGGYTLEPNPTLQGWNSISP